MITLDDISMAVIGIIRLGAVFRFIYCMVRLQGAEEEQVQFTKRAKTRWFSMSLPSAYGRLRRLFFTITEAERRINKLSMDLLVKLLYNYRKDYFGNYTAPLRFVEGVYLYLTWEYRFMNELRKKRAVATALKISLEVIYKK